MNEVKVYQGLSEPLLDWYRVNRRDLPWRRTKSPYEILVSEVMLQQTRVETVRDYYRRFLERFPDAQSLAGAPETDVLKIWEGLGYYTRARNLQQAAKAVVDLYGGVFPDNAAALRTLPGVGAYTAAAVASIAFGEAAPAIDGNVKRVASRLFGIREDINQPASLRRIQAALDEAIPTADPGGFNQAMMELGATLCLPRAPRCDLCPVARRCDACREGDQESLPVHEKKKATREVAVAVCIPTYGERALLVRRHERLLHGLYVYWLYEGVTARQTVTAQLAEDGLSVTRLTDLGEARHVFTHRIWRMHLYHGELDGLPDAAWLTEHNAVLVDAGQMSALPLPTAMKAAREAALTLLQGK